MVITNVKFSCPKCMKDRPARNVSMTLLKNGAECYRGICMVCNMVMFRIINIQNDRR